MSDEMSPEMDGGVPLCAGDDCPQYDGKRCRLTGFRPDPGQSCEPAVREIVDERDRLRARVSELETGPSARPLDEWHEDHGAVLWWTLPVCEPPYVGSPMDDDFPDYVTHWTPIVEPSNRADDPQKEER